MLYASYNELISLLQVGRPRNSGWRWLVAGRGRGVRSWNVVLDRLPGVPEHIETNSNDFVDILVRGHEGGVNDSLEVFLEFIELVSVRAVPIW